MHRHSNATNIRKSKTDSVNGSYASDCDSGFHEPGALSVQPIRITTRRNPKGIMNRPPSSSVDVGAINAKQAISLPGSRTQLAADLEATSLSVSGDLDERLIASEERIGCKRESLSSLSSAEVGPMRMTLSSTEGSIADEDKFTRQHKNEYEKWQTVRGYKRHALRGVNSQLVPTVRESCITKSSHMTESTTRKRRPKPRSKSVDSNKRGASKSVFSPFYSKILSEEEMSKRREWAEVIKQDCILEEEYYKVPYEECNREVILGRFSRSEPKLNFKRKSKKKVSFSEDTNGDSDKEKRKESVDAIKRNVQKVTNLDSLNMNGTSLEIPLQQNDNEDTQKTGIKDDIRSFLNINIDSNSNLYSLAQLIREIKTQSEPQDCQEPIPQETIHTHRKEITNHETALLQSQDSCWPSTQSQKAQDPNFLETKTLTTNMCYSNAQECNNRPTVPQTECHTFTEDITDTDPKILENSPSYSKPNAHHIEETILNEPNASLTGNQTCSNVPADTKNKLNRKNNKLLKHSKPTTINSECYRGSNSQYLNENSQLNDSRLQSNLTDIKLPGDVYINDPYINLNEDNHSAEGFSKCHEPPSPINNSPTNPQEIFSPSQDVINSITSDENRNSPPYNDDNNNLLKKNKRNTKRQLTMANQEEQLNKQDTSDSYDSPLIADFTLNPMTISNDTVRTLPPKTSRKNSKKQLMDNQAIISKTMREREAFRKRQYMQLKESQQKQLPFIQNDSVNIFMRKNANFTDHHIQLTTCVNSLRPNVSVSRVQVPFSAIRDQWLWTKHFWPLPSMVDQGQSRTSVSSPSVDMANVKSPPSTCSTASTVDSPISGVFSSGETTRNGPFTGKEDLSSPTPSFCSSSGSSTSGCFSASCSPSPLPTTMRVFPLPTPL